MLTGYKINGKEIAIDTSSQGITQTTYSTFKMTSNDVQKGGNSFVENHGQIKVLPNEQNKYYKTITNGYAAYGTSTKGGMPDLELTATGTYYFKCVNTVDRLLLQYGTQYSGKELSGSIKTLASYRLYNGHFPEAIKLWFSICGGGGGGYYSNATQFDERGDSIGGGGAGACVFSWTIADYDTMLKFVVGSGGSGGYERWLKVGGEDPKLMDQLVGSRGEDTTFSVGHLVGGQYEFYTMINCHGGGYRSRVASTCDGSSQQQTQLFSGGFSGGSGGTGQLKGRNVQISAGYGSVSIQNIHYNDYQYIYGLSGTTSIYTNGGDGGNASYIAGGGGCGFFNSVAGNKDQKNGTLGSGGCSINATADGAGSGGNGACHVWFTGADHYELNENITNALTVRYTIFVNYYIDIPDDIPHSAEIAMWLNNDTQATTKTALQWRAYNNIIKFTIKKAILTKL